MKYVSISSLLISNIKLDIGLDGTAGIFVNESYLPQSQASLSNKTQSLSSGVANILNCPP